MLKGVEDARKETDGEECTASRAYTGVSAQEDSWSWPDWNALAWLWLTASEVTTQKLGTEKKQTSIYELLVFRVRRFIVFQMIIRN